MESVDNIRQVVVIGTGMMGPGIALSMARGGIPVAIYGRSLASLTRAEANVTQNCQRLIEHELAGAGELDEARQRIQLTDDLPAAAKSADMIFESVVEDMEVKKDLFSEVCTLCSAETILATNTSGMSITKIATAVTYPERFVGTHFWNPPYVMPLVEVIKGDLTSDETMEITCRVIEKAGKKPIRVQKDIPGFLGNRLQSALQREALALAERCVATPRDIDTMIKYSFAMRMPPLGVFEHADMVGVDMVQSVHSYLLADLDRRTTPSPVTTEQLEKGLLGVKSNQGFYEWTPEKVEERQRKRDEAIIRQLRYMDEDVL